MTKAKTNVGVSPLVIPRLLFLLAHSEELPHVDLGLGHPARQLEISPGQPCVLGVERLRLGRLPQGALLSRVLSIRNCLLHTVRTSVPVHLRYLVYE